MKSVKLLKILLLPCAAFLWSSCIVPEDVISSGEFQPLKTLTISPDSAKVGDKIIITGENFISKKEYNHVWFSPNVKAVIDSVTATQLFLKVPQGAVTGEVVVSNGAYLDTIKSGFKIISDPDAPQNIEFSPQVGYEGTRIFVSGKNIDDPSTALISGIKTTITWYGNVNNLSFVVPKGARSGKIVIINKSGKAASSNKELKIITENQKITASFHGIKVIRKPYFDTLTLSANYNISRTLIPNHDLFYNVYFCFAFLDYLPYPDSILQSFQFTPNYTNPYNYQAVHLSIDSAQKIIKSIRISTYYYSLVSGQNTNDYSERDCNTTKITLQNIPYELINNKKYFRLNAEELQKHLLNYSSTEDHYHFKAVGGYSGNTETHKTVDGILEILPDAYFELTLE